LYERYEESPSLERTKIEEKHFHHFFTSDFLHKNDPPQNKSRNSIHLFHD